MRPIAVALALTFLPIRAFAQDAPPAPGWATNTETVTVQADSLAGLWKIGFPVWADRVGLELQFGPMLDDFCRVDGARGDAHVHCFESLLPLTSNDGDVIFEGNHIHLVWGTMMARAVVDATQTSPGIFTGNFTAKLVGIPFNAPDQLSKIVPSEKAPDAAGSSVLLTKILNDIAAGVPVRSLTQVGRTALPNAKELRALGPLVEVFYLGRTPSSREEWALRKDQPGKQE